MNWYTKVIKQYADFKGRARRREYWVFTLFYIVFYIILGFIDQLTGLKVSKFGILTGIYSVFFLIPSIAVAVRRLHDVGKSGWMLLISLIPLVGAIWLLVLMLQEGNNGSNKYGVNPKEESKT